MYHHRITYKPDPIKRGQHWFDAFLCVIVFAFIGVLLAWKG